MTMNNVREKLATSRDACPGLSEEVYALVDYLAKVANDTFEPSGLALFLYLSMEDIRRGSNGFARAESKEIPEYLKEHKSQVLAQAVYVPQIVDAIADKDFADEFRKICKETLGFDPPRREEKFDLNTQFEGDYPEYITVAVNWWANAIYNPKFDNGEDSMASLMALMLSSKNSFTKEQLSTFKKELASEIIKNLNDSYDGECSLRVDYHPEGLLFTAAKKAGIDDDTSFPWKTCMHISEKEVSVSAGYGADWQTLWKKA